VGVVGCGATVGLVNRQQQMSDSTPQRPNHTPQRPDTTDYVRLVKYGDSLYRCKELKRAAMVR